MSTNVDDQKFIQSNGVVNFDKIWSKVETEQMSSHHKKADKRLIVNNELIADGSTFFKRKMSE